MPEEEKQKQEEMVDIDTSGPEVSISTIGSFFLFSSSGIVSPSMFNIDEIYLQGFRWLLIFHHHLAVLLPLHRSGF